MTSLFRAGLPQKRPQMTPSAASTESTVERDQVTRSALTASIDEGRFEDVKFFAFSARTSKGRVYAPRPLYGNSRCIRNTAPHFHVVLTQGFAEGDLVDLNAEYPRGRAAAVDDYEYAEDSDLEDIDDEVVLTDVTPTPEPPSAAPDIKASIADESSVEEKPQELPNEKSATEKEGYTETCAAETDASEAVHCVMQMGGPAVDNKSPQTVALPSGRPGRLVFIDDMAHRTWRAFIYYSYFGVVSFAPLRSQGMSVDTTKAAPSRRTGMFIPPQCSPKSMYRLADKYDIPELKTEAKADIQSKLTSSNIYIELFSSFTSLRPDIQDMEVDYLCNALDRSEVLSELPVWVDYLAQGRLPAGAARAVSILISKLVRLGSLSSPPSCRSCDRPCVWYCKFCRSTSSAK